VATPAGSLITQHLLSPAAARRAVEMIEAHGAQAWVFCGPDWLAHDPAGPYVGREQHTVGFEPTVVRDFGRSLDAAAKIVAVSADFDLLTRLERHARPALADRATVARSQPYYLDFTHPLANKGVALSELAKLLAIPAAQIAVIGDGGNDVAMFERSGLSIAMGNADPDVQRAADFVTDRNDQDGFAKAIEWFVLGGHRSNAPVSRPAACAGVDDASRAG
jgi:Cof subfamily protein (haloacid dehalogenase superfamily)